MGMGFGNYWGPMGPCTWYLPVGVSTSSSMIGHRPTLGNSVTGGSGTVRQPRMATRNPVGLQPAIVNHRAAEAPRREPFLQSSPREDRSASPARPITIQREGQRQGPGRTIERSPSRGTIESRPSINRGGFDSAPSRGGGGGSVPMRRGR
jgi:hypothetical protein